ncbi:MAG: metallophosphatase family protein [Prevotellaceae bacterium]|jgi:putative phosphoesterase|nr:metallophosphatase family protein [Prevotellaceae bacterium]
MKIGLLSDTHGTFDDKLKNFFADVDEIWHAGDFGNIATADAIAAFKPLRGVHGNCDGQDVRIVYPKILRFICENVDVMITHIGGYPSHYDYSIYKEFLINPPKLFICGHSHILKVMNDKQFGFLHINPGAAGNYGFHAVLTATRFEISGDNIANLEVGEWNKARMTS